MSMRKLLITLLFVMPGPAVLAQEFNCQISVIAPQVANAQPRVFQTLEVAIKEFFQNRRFTNLNFAPSERLDINLLLTIKGVELNGGTKCCCGHWHGQFTVQLIALAFKYRVRLHQDLDVEITGRPTIWTDLALAG